MSVSVQGLGTAASQVKSEVSDRGITFHLPPQIAGLHPVAFFAFVPSGDYEGQISCKDLNVKFKFSLPAKDQPPIQEPPVGPSGAGSGSGGISPRSVILNMVHNAFKGIGNSSIPAGLYWSPA